ncbi:hypothetical protein, partial [Paenibacillus sp. 2TAB19]|uniref:hypothetical protein n=1 Tax=Paenibacillus sp. 2TAB19 TaxID=3233003 RepID=UPI003F991BCC
LIQYKDNLYFVDIENKMIRNALLEQVGRYDLKDSERKIADKKDENLGLVWGAYASINQDGTKMVYFSNRNAAFNDNLNGEMWIKDLKTGEEKTVRNWEHVLGWGTDNELILRTIRDSTINIESYNIESGQSLQIAENYISVGFSHPYLIYQQEPKMMIVYQVETKEKKVIESETINLIKVLEINKYSSEIQWAIGLNAPDRTKIDRNILVFDLLHGVIKEINPLKNTLIESVQWVDSSQFLVNAREIGSSQNSTYFVDNDKLWGDE